MEETFDIAFFYIGVGIWVLMSTADMESHMRELYDIEISDSMISQIADNILPLVREWEEYSLEEVYAVVFMDAIPYHVRREN